MTTVSRPIPATQLYNDSPDDSSSQEQFVFARIHGDIWLVQIPLNDPTSTSAALAAVDVKFFRHELATIFRFSHDDFVHPDDICILHSIDNDFTRYEEESGAVFLARDVMVRLQKLLTESREFATRRMSKLRRWS